MVEAVLCDIDGTLVQSNWHHAAAWRDAFAVADIPLEVEEVRRQIGKGGDQLIPVFVPWWKRKIIEDPLKAYRKYIFHADYFHKIEPIPKVRDLLLRMKQSGIRISIASSADPDDLDTYKKIARIEDLVEKSSTAGDAKKSKPHPDIFEATLRKLGLPPNKVLALGDTPWDAEAAGNADIRTVGVTTGGWSRHDLLAAGCIEVYTDAADLLENLQQSAFMQW
jgi:HAD superfamily hydrolase (TIGR01509 family)